MVLFGHSAGGGELGLADPHHGLAALGPPVDPGVQRTLRVMVSELGKETSKETSLGMAADGARLLGTRLHFRLAPIP